MDVSNIVSLSSSLMNIKTNSTAGVAVLNKALDSQVSAAAGLIQALPQLPANPNIGRNINTTA